MIPTLAAGQSATVTFKATANALSAVNPIFNVARVDYEFFPFAGYPATGFSNSNPVAVFIIARDLTVREVDPVDIHRSVDKSRARGNIVRKHNVGYGNTARVSHRRGVGQDIALYGKLLGQRFSRDE